VYRRHKLSRTLRGYSNKKLKTIPRKFSQPLAGAQAFPQKVSDHTGNTRLTQSKSPWVPSEQTRYTGQGHRQIAQCIDSPRVLRSLSSFFQPLITLRHYRQPLLPGATAVMQEKKTYLCICSSL